MKTAGIPVFTLAGLALAAPVAAVATPSSLAARNCAQALAQRLNAHLARVDDEPNLAMPFAAAPAPHQDQYILTVRPIRGVQTEGTPMVCTVDRNGHVTSLHRTAAAETMPLIDAASQ